MISRAYSFSTREALDAAARFLARHGGAGLKFPQAFIKEIFSCCRPPCHVARKHRCRQAMRCRRQFNRPFSSGFKRQKRATPYLRRCAFDIFTGDDGRRLGASIIYHAAPMPAVDGARLMAFTACSRLRPLPVEMQLSRRACRAIARRWRDLMSSMR